MDLFYSSNSQVIRIIFISASSTHNRQNHALLLVYLLIVAKIAPTRHIFITLFTAPGLQFKGSQQGFLEMRKCFMFFTFHKNG